jgi:site-specific recombinase XerD
VNLTLTSVFAENIRDYLRLQKEAGKYVDKPKCYLRSLDRFLTEQNVTEKVLDEALVVKWMASKSVAQATKSNMYKAAKGFSEYIASLGYPASVPEPVRVPLTYVPYIFSESEIDNIFVAADNINPNSYVISKFQFAMLLRLLYGCGLRLGEALSLKKSDIDSENGVLLIRGAKGNRDRFVPMEYSLSLVLNNYIDYLLHNESADAWIFENNDTDKNRKKTGKPRSLSWAIVLFREVLSKAGIDMRLVQRGGNDSP